MDVVLRGRSRALGPAVLVVVSAFGCSAPGSTISLYSENDFWGIGAGTDKDYTNGLELEIGVPLDAAPGVLRELGESLFVDIFSLSPRQERDEALDQGSAAERGLPPMPEEVTGSARTYSQGVLDGLVEPEPMSDPEWTKMEADLYEQGYEVARAALAMGSLRTGGESTQQPTKRMLIALGQQMYTPSNTSAAMLIPDDRPYAAFLYASLGYEAVLLDHDVSRRHDRKSTVKLALGVVGPAALGEEIQNGFHDIIGDDDVNGWDNQVGNEPGVLFTARRDDRAFFHQFGSPGEFAADTISHFGASLGNVSTKADLGSTLRIGYNLPRDWSARIIAPEVLGEASEERFAAYVFAGADGRLVLRDIYLDGNTFEDSHSVDKKPIVADFSVGMTLDWGRFAITYSYVHRTEEFEGQEDPHRFGSLSLRFQVAY